MAIEIERKFLPKNDAWRSAAHRVIDMAQGYLNDADSEIRKLLDKEFTIQRKPSAGTRPSVFYIV